MASDGHTAYVSDNAAGVVRAISLPDLRVRWQAAVGGRPGPLLATLDGVLVSLFAAAAVVELSAADGSPLARHRVGGGPGQMGLGDGGVLVACAEGGAWDLAGGHRAGGAGFLLGTGAGGTWTSDQAGGRLIRLEDGHTVELGPLHPFWAATGPDRTLWVTAEGKDEDRDPGAVVVLDESLQPRVVATPRDPDGVVNAGDRMFVAAHGEHAVWVLDRAGRHSATWAAGSDPVAVAADVQQGLLVVVTDARE